MKFAVILLVLLTVGATAEETVTLHLVDGRSLTGVYDIEHGTITLPKPRAIIRIRKEDIKSMVVHEAPAPAAAAAPITADAVIPVSSGPDIQGWNTTKEHAVALRNEATTAEISYLRAALHAANLDAIKLPSIGEDPRQSELAVRQEISEYNAKLEGLRRFRNAINLDKKAEYLHNDPQFRTTPRPHPLLITAFEGYLIDFSKIEELQKQHGTVPSAR